jgi:hypothetical protein
MKIFFLILLVPVFARAYPGLGDFVAHEAFYEGSIVRIEKRILTHDQIHDVFTVHTKATFRGEILQDQRLEIPRTFLYTPSKVSDVLKNCIRREGARGQVSVQSKTIEVCEFFHEDSQLTYMIGDVPFGQVRYQIYLEEEEFLDFFLKEFASN